MGATTTYRRMIKNKMKSGEIVLCGICDEPIDLNASIYNVPSDEKGGLTVDHIIPKSAGGKNHPDNFQPAHLKCNRKKGGIMRPGKKPSRKERVFGYHIHQWFVDIEHGTQTCLIPICNKTKPFIPHRPSHQSVRIEENVRHA